MSCRKVKLQPKYRHLAHSIQMVPELKISGKWLEELGFKPGQRVCITARDKEITIKPVE